MVLEGGFCGELKKKINWVTCEEFIILNDKLGLGVRCFDSTNLVMLAKYWWWLKMGKINSCSFV